MLWHSMSAIPDAAADVAHSTGLVVPGRVEATSMDAVLLPCNTNLVEPPRLANLGPRIRNLNLFNLNHSFITILSTELITIV